jgi:hypothetical protein
LPSGISRPPDARSGFSPEQGDEQAILCAGCGAAITRSNQAVRVNNRHEHAFFNPAGIAFEVRCFRQAPGVSTCGEPTDAFTWFPGFSWQIVVCTACQAHLGWLFCNGHSFHALIVDRLK